VNFFPLTRRRRRRSKIKKVINFNLKNMEKKLEPMTPHIPVSIDRARQEMLKARENLFRAIGQQIVREEGLDKDPVRAKIIMDFLGILYQRMVLSGLNEHENSMVEVGLNIFTVRDSMQKILSPSSQNPPAGQETAGPQQP
jgi:hypothetical protein